MMRGICYLAVLTCVLFTGCVDDVIFGDDCPRGNARKSGGALSYIGDPTCTGKSPENCRFETGTDPEKYFEIRRCPVGYQCREDEKVGIYYCEFSQNETNQGQDSACRDGKSMCSGICVDISSDDEHCGENCESCKELGANGLCHAGVCEVYACVNNEYPVFVDDRLSACKKTDDRHCAPKDMKSTDRVVDCSAIAGAAEVSCSSGTCIVRACKSGYMIGSDGQSCVLTESSGCDADGSLCLTKGVSDAKCVSGECQIMDCEKGYHISPDKKGCVKNSEILCGATNSSEVLNCRELISNYVSGACDDGVCHVTQSEAGYHLSEDRTSTVENSEESCGANDSESPVNCKTQIPHYVSGSCDDGVCHVSTCEKGYHLNSSKMACDENTNEACGAVDSSNTVACSATGTMCNIDGKCACTSVDFLVNPSTNTCVHKACVGIPGVTAGEPAEFNYYYLDGKDYRCNATVCSDGYKLSEYPTENSVISVCRPVSDCTEHGYPEYKYGEACSAMVEDGYVTRNTCREGYRLNYLACVESRYCCGKDTDPNGLYQCTNCVALGKTSCDLTNGECQ